MSIQTYVPEDNLLVPVTTGTTIQAYTDVNGEAWVAKAGIKGGQWYKAREVLHACVGRAAGFTPTTTAAVFGWDTVVSDSMGMYVGSPTFGFVVPLLGMYHLNAQWYGTIATLAEYSGIRIYGGANSATMVTNENMIQNLAGGGVCARSVTNIYANAGDIFTMQYWQSVAGTGSAGLQCRFFISYVGSG